MGTKKKDLHYSYADVLTAEVLVELSEHDPQFWAMFEKAAEETRKLVIRFTRDAELLIALYLKLWGFMME